MNMILGCIIFLAYLSVLTHSNSNMHKQYKGSPPMLSVSGRVFTRAREPNLPSNTASYGKKRYQDCMILNSTVFVLCIIKLITTQTYSTFT